MKTLNLKIHIVLPHLTCGGTERAAAELANYISGKGGDASIVLMYKEDHYYDIHPGVKIIEPTLTKRSLGKYFYVFFLVCFLREQFKKEKPDLIFALGYVAFTLFSSFGLKTKVVMSLRSSPKRIRFPNNKLLNTTYNLSHWLLKKRVNGIIAQTKLAGQVYQKRYTCPITIIPNFLRELKVHSCERLNQIINVGHCSFEKGQEYLIRAFAKLNAPDWNLIIVGDGPKRKELEELCHCLEISNRVLFAGYQKDVDFFLSQSKIFAFTSIIEGYPNALIEAMATPLPPVSFDCDAGPSDIIVDNENGFLVEVGDIEMFANRLQLLIDNPELRQRMQLNAANIKLVNDLNKIIPMYLEFFQRIGKG
jgi:GalNAc-alpha-(1->4)-GalNAc-alpha-(1->3)-diNAcBac-PP-undecaprenol alpha-1,4-N-acetyl-D-galactosaminyltransferase